MGHQVIRRIVTHLQNAMLPTVYLTNPQGACAAFTGAARLQKL